MLQPKHHSKAMKCFLMWLRIVYILDVFNGSEKI